MLNSHKKFSEKSNKTIKLDFNNNKFSFCCFVYTVHKLQILGFKSIKNEKSYPDPDPHKMIWIRNHAVASTVGCASRINSKHWQNIRTFTYNCPGDLFLLTSVVDPNTLNLDPDPGFWPNLDPDPGPNLDPDPGLYYQFWNKKNKII